MIYVASSWRNQYQPAIVAGLRDRGFEVYDFREPGPGERGFHWSDIDPLWKGWNPERYRECLAHPIAVYGFLLDKGGLEACTSCVLVMPCGRSAHLEAAYAAAKGKPTAVLLLEPAEPELMYRLLDGVLVSMDELWFWAGAVEDRASNSRAPARRSGA